MGASELYRHVSGLAPRGRLGTGLSVRRDETGHRQHGWPRRDAGGGGMTTERMGFPYVLLLPCLCFSVFIEPLFSVGSTFHCIQGSSAFHCIYAPLYLEAEWVGEGGGGWGLLALFRGGGGGGEGAFLPFRFCFQSGFVCRSAYALYFIESISHCKVRVQRQWYEDKMYCKDFDYVFVSDKFWNIHTVTIHTLRSFIWPTS